MVSGARSYGWKSTISNVIAVRGNRNTLFALKSDGTLWTWGLETYLGNGTAPATRTRATQMTLPSVNPIKMIGVTRNDADNAASYYVVNANGNMYALGNNSERQLEIGQQPSVALGFSRDILLLLDQL